MFEIRPMSAERYRQDTRRIAFVVIAIFLVLALLLSSLAVQLFATPAATTSAGTCSACSPAWPPPSPGAPETLVHRLDGPGGVRLAAQAQPHAHHQRHAPLKAGVAARQPEAIKLLRFYHLGVTQMHQLDGNLTELAGMVREIDAHRELMEELGMDAEQTHLDPVWIEAVKGIG